MVGSMSIISGCYCHPLALGAAQDCFFFLQASVSSSLKWELWLLLVYSFTMVPGGSWLLCPIGTVPMSGWLSRLASLAGSGRHRLEWLSGSKWWDLWGKWLWPPCVSGVVMVVVGGGSGDSLCAEKVEPPPPSLAPKITCSMTPWLTVLCWVSES